MHFNGDILHITLLIFLTIERTQIPQSSKKLAKYFLCLFLGDFLIFFNDKY